VIPAGDAKFGVHPASLPVWLMAVDAFLIFFFLWYVRRSYRLWKRAAESRPLGAAPLSTDTMAVTAEANEGAGRLEVVTAHTVTSAVASLNRSGERSMAAQSVGTFVTVSVAGASILIAASGVLLGIEPNKQVVPPEVFTQLSLGIVFLVVSLGAGAVAASYVLNHLHHDESVAQNALVEASAAAQLSGLVFGAICFTISVFLL
jgi:hypothetical protein